MRSSGVRVGPNPTARPYEKGKGHRQKEMPSDNRSGDGKDISKPKMPRTAKSHRKLRQTHGVDCFPSEPPERSDSPDTLFLNLEPSELYKKAFCYLKPPSLC